MIAAVAVLNVIGEERCESQVGEKIRQIANDNGHALAK